MIKLMVSNQFGLKENILKSIIKEILKYVKVKRIYLFGSRVKGNFKKNSDIDIAIETFDDSQDILFLNELLNEDIDTLLKIDIVHLNKTNDQLKREILNHGIIIYQNEKDFLIHK
ncbi:MAG: type VII toxin-antitoxin system MntA family adenylyltransferase antitoxin [bacterium]|jgi:predicted nucleotidyltransferase